jgi:hypothetical protein
MHINGFVFIFALIAFYVICTGVANGRSNSARIVLLAAIVIGMLCLGAPGLYGLGGLALGFAVAYGISRVAGRR